VRASTGLCVGEGVGEGVADGVADGAGEEADGVDADGLDAGGGEAAGDAEHPARIDAASTAPRADHRSDRRTTTFCSCTSVPFSG